MINALMKVISENRNTRYYMLADLGNLEVGEMVSCLPCELLFH
jgi:hypothetical protein